MADKVIVVGVKRGNERLPSGEIIQMVGRAGRRHDGSTYQADIIIEEEYFSEVMDEIEHDASMNVESHISTVDNMAFHILPDICNGGVTTIKDAEYWYSKTLGAFQGGKAPLDKVIDLLKASEAVQDGSVGLIPTDMGKIAARLYFNPADLKAWRENFNILFQMGLETDDLAVAWALGNVPVTRMAGDFGNRWEIVTECKGNMPPCLEIMEGATTTVVLWWSAIGGPSVGKMRNQMLNLRGDFGRIHRALVSLDHEVTGWDKEDFFNDLKRRVERGIPSFLAELCKINGITKSRAEYLYNVGVRDRADIREMAEGLEGEVDDNFMDVLKAIANGIR
jgi:replicative superfamily II helicase